MRAIFIRFYKGVQGHRGIGFRGSIVWFPNNGIHGDLGFGFAGLRGKV